MPSLEINFNLISLRTLIDTYFFNPLSICWDLFSSSLGRLALPCYVIGCYSVFSVFSGVLGCSFMVLGEFWVVTSWVWVFSGVFFMFSKVFHVPLWFFGVSGYL